MDSFEQPQTPYTSPAVAPAPVSRHARAAVILIPLIILAIALFVIVGMADKKQEAPLYDENSYVLSNEATPGAGEDPDATAEESAAIRADLEASDTDGVSEGI